MCKQTTFRIFGILQRFSIFRGEESGSISTVFACALMALIGMSGAAIDLSNAYLARQKLSQVAVMTCQYANRTPIVINTISDGATYTSQVNQFISTSLAQQAFPYTQTNGTPFTFVSGGGASVALTASVPTHFMKIMRVTSVPISVSMDCYSTPNLPRPPPRGTYVLQERFNTPITTWNGVSTYYMPDGTVQARPVVPTPRPTSTTVSYTGRSGVQWYVTGYCLEQNVSGQIGLATPDSLPAIELDCENGSGSAGNSSISTPVDLAIGTYELRYFYSSRVSYDNYNPATLCASTAADLDWVNDTKSANFTYVARTNQVNVYLDKKTTASPPTHVTLDGRVTLAGANLIDHCVYAARWIERSVKINVKTAGTYWLTFAADGANDSYGGLLNNLRLCSAYCPGNLQDSFPTSWTGGTTLFADTFNAVRTYLSPYGLNWYNPTADLTASTAATYGWPNWASGTGLVPNSWAVAGKNIVTLWQSYTLGCPVTSQNCLSLNYQTSSSYISRPFLLMPGYYEVSYDYQASLKYTDTTGTYCGPTPMAASYSYLASLPTSTAINRFTPWFQRSTPADNTIAVFASHPGLVSTPNPVPFNTTTTYMNPGSSAPSTTATYPPNSINLQAYDARQKNPLIDICTFSSTAVTRRATIKITKPAYYWITFASFSSTTSISGAIGNIALKVVGGPYAKPPSGVITVPVPGGQPNSTGSFVGFTTVQNEFAP